MTLTADELDEQLAALTDASGRERLYRSIVERVRTAQPLPNPVRRDDLMGGLTAAWRRYSSAVVP